jgi:hypothetical protein
MEVSYYICSKCKAYSGEMKLSKEKYTPTEDELHTNPDLDFIAHEILMCPCGKKNTWFSLKKIIEDPDGHYKKFLINKEE